MPAMRAATFEAVGRPLVVRDVERPTAGVGQAILKVAACGICGSDLHATVVDGMVKPGSILGHELAGEVVELGLDPVGPWKVGDRVHALGSVSCGQCSECLGGRAELCEKGAALGALLPGDLPGGYAEYVRVGTNDLVRLPPDVSFDVASLLEPLCTGMVSLRLADLRPGGRVLVLGGGPIGLAIASLCRLFGARQVVVSEPAPKRRFLAEELGATATIDPLADDDIAAAFAAAAGGDPDVVFEAVGRPGFLNHAVALVRRQGTVIAAGICMEPDLFDHVAAYAKEPTIRVPAYYTIGDARLLVDMLEQRRIDPSAMITHRIGLDELPRVFEELRTPTDQVKVVVRP